MLTLDKDKQKKILIALAAIFAVLVVYRVVTAEKPKTAPLTYAKGAIATSAVRLGLASREDGSDSLALFLRQREGKFPGVTRDIFRMENPQPKPKQPIKLATAPVPTVPEKTPEEIAAELARADMARFKLLGSMTDQDSSFFLSKDNESFIVRKGDTVQKTYKVKETGKDHLILLDTATRVEIRIELAGGELQKGR